MECQALLKMAIEAKDRGFHIGCVVADDDTTMKKIMRWDYKQMVEDGVLKKRIGPTTARERK